MAEEEPKGEGEEEASPPEREGSPGPHAWAPGSRLPWLAALGLPLALLDAGGGLGGLGLLSALAYDGALLLGSFLEGRLLGRRAPEVERHVPARLIVGQPNEVRLRLRNPSDRPISVTLRDDPPPGFEAEPEELRAELPPFARKELVYTVTPPRRGRFAFGDLHLKIEGGARLGGAILRVPAAATARVYPNILGPRRYELAARLGDLRSLGVQQVRQLGGGGELAQLREYVTGDSYRSLDWKASAKRQRPVTRVYQQERSQTVLLMIDAGRVMAPRLDRLAKLDHAINAALLLAYVALRNGDRVGLVVFADSVQAFVPPKAGPGCYRTLLEALYAVEATEGSTDFRRLAEFVRHRSPKRALLILFSDLLDETHALPLAEVATSLRKKHLPVCVTMHDAVAEAFADAPAEDAEAAYRRAAAADLLAEREGVKARLRKAGVGLVEASPGELAVAAVNRYLALKARRAL